MTQGRVRPRTCGCCPEGRNLLVNGKAETFCEKQNLFRSQQDKCNMGSVQDNESHEESPFNVDDKLKGERKESSHWSRGRLASFYLNGEKYVPEDTRTHPCWSIEENDLFTHLYTEGYSARQIAERINKSLYSIISKTRHYLRDKKEVELNLK